MIADKILIYVKEESQIDDIDNSTMLLENKILNSLQLIQFIVFLEKEFNVNIKDEDLNPDNFKNINTICEMVEKIKGSNS